MKQLFVKFGMIIVLGFASLTAVAGPSLLVVHNETDVESNAFLAGTASPMPTAPQTVARVPWFLVRLACLSQPTGENGTCQAEIKMATNTPNPVSLGLISVDIDSGDILPKEMSSGGYHFTANGPGEITLTQDS